jgi:hypothetical protein
MRNLLTSALCQGASSACHLFDQYSTRSSILKFDCKLTSQRLNRSDTVQSLIGADDDRKADDKITLSMVVACHLSLRMKWRETHGRKNGMDGMEETSSSDATQPWV